MCKLLLAQSVADGELTNEDAEFTAGILAELRG